MDKLWVLAAATTHARLFEARSLLKPLSQIHEFHYPEGRLHERDVYADKPGRMFDRMGEGRHAMEAPDVRDQQHHEFSREIAEYLQEGLASQRYSRLVLVAPPDFLGALREHLGSEVEKRIERTIHKNLVEVDPGKLHEYIF